MMALCQIFHVFFWRKFGNQHATTEIILVWYSRVSADHIIIMSTRELNPIMNDLSLKSIHALLLLKNYDFLLEFDLQIELIR